MRTPRLLVPLAAAALAALVAPVSAAAGPQVVDACGDGGSAARVGDTRHELAAAPAARDLRSASVSVRDGAVVGVLELCGAASTGYDHLVQWSHEGDCWTTLSHLAPNLREQRTSAAVTLVEVCRHEHAGPAGLLTQPEVREVSSVTLPAAQAAVVDGDRLVLTVPLSAVPAASAGRYATGTAWLSTYAAVGEPDGSYGAYSWGTDQLPYTGVTVGYDGGHGPGYTVGEDEVS